MAKYEVGFDGDWQERFDDREDAIRWAMKVAETGRIVDVAIKRRGFPRKFLTAFPESERAARRAAWAIPSNYASVGPF
jgi:hypothetical protein